MHVMCTCTAEKAPEKAPEAPEKAPAKAPEAPEEAPEKYPAFLLLFAIVFNACHVHLYC